MTSSECPPAAPRRTPSSEADDAAWVRCHQQRLWRFVRMLGASPADADEVLQDALLAGLGHSERARWTEADASRWLRAVARNLFYQTLRRRRRQWQRERLDAEGLAVLPAPLSDVEDRERDRAAHLADQLRICIDRLGPRSREVLELRYGEGLGRDAIGRRLAIGREGVKSLLQRIRAKLRTCLERRHP